MIIHLLTRWRSVLSSTTSQKFRDFNIIQRPFYGASYILMGKEMKDFFWTVSFVTFFPISIRRSIKRFLSNQHIFFFLILSIAISISPYSYLFYFFFWKVIVWCRVKSPPSFNAFLKWPLFIMYFLFIFACECTSTFRFQIAHFEIEYSIFFFFLILILSILFMRSGPCRY